MKQLFDKLKATTLFGKGGRLKSIFSDPAQFESKGLSDELRLIMEATKFLPENSLIIERIHCIEHGITERVKCFMCNNTVNFQRPNAKYSKFCSRSCNTKYQSTQRINPFSTEEGKRKLITTKIKKYGTPHHLAKSRQTMVEKYGSDNASKLQFVKDKKSSKANSPGHQEARMVKQRATNTARYGAPFLMQVPELLEEQTRKRYKTKQFQFKTGEIVNVIGYEHHALRLLEEEGYGFSDLKVSNRKMITYYDTTRNRDRKYQPDIHIPSENKYIEVKSEYTIRCDIQLNKDKWNGCISQGHALEIWVIGNDGELISRVTWTQSS